MNSLTPYRKKDVVLDDGLAKYLQKVNQFPMLAEQEEYELINQYIKHADLQAAHKLASSHLRLVVKIAINYRNYGFAISDLIAEGNIGLLNAIKKFDPQKRVRLSTYAIWWIKAAIYNYILANWSLIKIGTSAKQKQLFYNLRKIKNRLGVSDNVGLDDNQANAIAKSLNIKVQDVKNMEVRLLNKDISLDSNNDNNEEGIKLIDTLEDKAYNQEQQINQVQQNQYIKNMINNSLAQLDDRQQDIIKQRFLTNPSATLSDLANKYNVSCERIRQIENQAMYKMQKFLKQSHDL